VEEEGLMAAVAYFAAPACTPNPFAWHIASLDPTIGSD
jgi:hypothetical protein